MRTKTSWRKLIGREMGANEEAWKDVEFCTLNGEQLSKEFDDDYGSEEGAPFTIWTRKHVYFPATYDGAEWCASVARNPGEQPQATRHVGGG